MTKIKFCGFTRTEDVAQAIELGVDYVGAVFAGGPRALTIEQAKHMFSVVPSEGPQRVGVFGAHTPKDLAKAVQMVPLDVVQLHKQRREDAQAAAPTELRHQLARPIWVVLRCTEGLLPNDAEQVVEGADAILLDAAVPGRLGGAGVALPWEDMASAVARLRGTRPLILAGGLRPENVGQAITALRPDVVDVSSGIETQMPGVKDPARMRAFVEAVLGSAQGD